MTLQAHYRSQSYVCMDAFAICGKLNSYRNYFNLVVYNYNNSDSPIKKALIIKKTFEELKTRLILILVVL